MSWAANQPTPVETHLKLRSWGRYDLAMKRDIRAALLLLSEVPISQGQAEAGAKTLSFGWSPTLRTASFSHIQNDWEEIQ